MQNEFQDDLNQNDEPNNFNSNQELENSVVEKLLKIKRELIENLSENMEDERLVNLWIYI